VEVLSVNVVHDVGLLVELVLIQILDTHAYNNKLNSSRVRQTRRRSIAPRREG
jgi:hypothetical protein